MLTKIFSVIVVGLLAVIVWMGFSHRAELADRDEAVATAKGERDSALEEKGAATTRAETAEGINKSNLGMLATLNADLQLQKEVTRQTQERSEAIQSNYDQLNSRYQEALQNDSQTRDWASIPLPESVSSGRLLYHAATAQGGDGGGNPAAAGPAAGAAPVPAKAVQTTGER